MNETILTIIVVVLVTLIISYMTNLQKKSTWQGVVVDKKTHYDDESGKTTYYLIFKTDKGKKKVNLSSAQIEYDKWNIGDKGIKKSGAYLPEKHED